ncbi:hypothetical protein BGW38_001570, partial [Lunasporangiospora selenospora]
RRGKPTLTETNQKDFVAPQGWTHKVQWASGDSLEPDTYRDLIKDTDAVVHTVGILLEDDYKEIVHSRTFNELTTSLQTAIRGRNPLDTSADKSSKSRNTYERFNRDAAIMVSDEAGKAGVESFVFLSAAFAPPAIPNRYVTTKREAEAHLLSHPSGQLRSIVLRPGFMSTPERPLTLPLAGLLQVSSAILGKSIRGTIPLAQAASTPPVSMETVARSVMNAIENPSVRGIIDYEGIEELANNPKAAHVGANKNTAPADTKEQEK